MTHALQKPPRYRPKLAGIDRRMTWLLAKGDSLATKVNPLRMTLSRAGYILLGLPALFPLICVYPDIAEKNGSDLNVGAVDTLGTGAELCLLTALLITPLIIVTGKRWFFPLRKWYGIMTGVISLVAGVIASIVSIQFGSTPIDRMISHLSLVTGFILVVMVIPLLAASSKYSQKRLGKYWPKVHRLTYVFWFLLAFHLYVLYGINPHSMGAVTSQRFYLFMACSIALLIYRLPGMKKAMTSLRKLGFTTVIYIASIPWVALFVVPLIFIVNEEVVKGVATIASHSIAN